MEQSVDFFRDEIREGFYVPTSIKYAWANELSVLAEIDRICRKHGIQYFADCGTLIGCIRHGGFVPWDDDLDIGMCREDYRKFREVADAELPEGYVIHDYERQKDHWLFLARVVGNEKICFDPDYLNEHHNFPWLTGVDIFLRDYVYDDYEEEKARDEEVMHIITVADAIVAGTLEPEAKEYWLSSFEERYEIRLDRSLDVRPMGIALYRLAEEQMSRLSCKDSHTVERIFPLVLKWHTGLPEKCYGQMLRLPFENISIPVPVAYHAVLELYYQDYFRIIRQGGGHDYPFYEGQKKEFEEFAGMRLPVYTYDPSTQMRADTAEAYKASLKGIAEECLARLEMLCEEICMQSEASDSLFDAFDALEESQQLAVDLGTLVESVKGEESETAKQMVMRLQDYCDALFAIAEGMNADAENRAEAFAGLRERLDALKATTECRILKRREVLFLATGPDLWKGFAEHYAHESDEDTDVLVVPIQVMFKDCYGRPAPERGCSDIEGYPAELTVMPWEQYDITLHFPDRVYIQDAYDGENPCLTIPPQFYASAIRDLCAELILVPALTPTEFAAGDRKEMHNMGAYVTAPGVVYADKVWLTETWLRERYLEKLCDWAGEETRGYWEQKLVVLPKREGVSAVQASAVSAPGSGKGQRILYVIGLDGLALKGEQFPGVLKDRLQSYLDNAEIAGISMVYYPEDREEWAKVSPELAGQLKKLVQEFTEDPRCNILDAACPEDIPCEAHDAYYGSASPLALPFKKAGKTVVFDDFL